MSFPIISAKELAKNAINKIKTSPVNEREFNFRKIEQGTPDFEINDLLELLNSPSESEVMKGLREFSNSFFVIFGSENNTKPNNVFETQYLSIFSKMSMEANNISFYRIFEAQYLAILAKQGLGEKATLLENGYTTKEPMEDGTLFIWCDELMFINNSDTYAINGDFIFSNFKFYEGEPAYVVGHVEKSAINTSF